MGADRVWGQIVLTKAETIDLSESDATSGLRPVDPQRDLMNGIRVDGAVQAYEYHNDWEFQLTATRYDLEDIKQTSVAKSVLRMVVMRSGKTSVQALYRVRCNDQRLELRMPGDSEFDADPKIDGRSVTMEVGQKRTYFIPLVRTREDESFLLELRYTLSDQTLPIAWPVFPTQPAIQKVYLCLYLPEEINLLDTTGPWTREFRWGLDGKGMFEPLNALVVGGDTVGTWHRSVLESRSIPPGQRNDAVAGRLLGWVSESVSVPDSYTTDGQLFVFSALQPGAPIDDGLRLLRLHRNYVDTATLVVTVILGVLLLPMGFGRRIGTVGTLAIALLFSTIYWPLAVWNLCDRTLVLPLLIVASLWCIQFLAWRLPGLMRQWYRSRPLTQPSPPSEGAGKPSQEKPTTEEPVEQSDAQDQAEGGRDNG